MIKELCNKTIYNDFLSKVVLTDEEKKILDMLLVRYTLVKISQEIGMSDRNVSRVVKSLKDKYEMYKKLEIAKLSILSRK